MNKRLLVAALLLVSALALVAHSLVWNFVTDDAFISFVYSRNLVRAGQLVFNLGERVEGYSNFLWTMILAGCLRVGLPPELMSRVLGTAFGIATFVTCVYAMRSLGARTAWTAWMALPALFLCTTPGYACWSSGGLETQMFTFFVTLGAARYLDRFLSDRDPDLLIGICFGLAGLTRPEGLLFFALTAAHRVVVLLSQRRYVPTRDDLRVAAAFVFLVGPHLLWRHAYYGWWLPNTYYVKASGGAGTWEQGGYYLARMAESFHLWILLPIVALALVVGDRELRRAASYLLFVACVFYVYVASVGGDFMGLFRFALPVLPLLVVMMCASLRVLGERFGVRVVSALAALLLLAHAAHGVLITKKAQQIGADRGIDTPGFLRWYTADRAAIGKWFGAHAKPDDFAAVGGAGAQVYYSGMASLDCYGLNDSHIAHATKALSNRPGHQKYAPLDYQLSRHPTIITSNYYRCCSPAYAHEPYRPSPQEIDEWNRRGYRYVWAEIPGLSFPFYSFLLRNDRGIATFPPVPPIDPFRDGAPK